MLDGKIIVVTGAGSGLGRATVVEIAKYGGTVVACDLDPDSAGTGADEDPVEETLERITDAGGDATANYGDITDQSYVRSMVSETLDEYGRIDGVVNYAGVLRDSMVFQMSREEFDSVIDVHLGGHFNLLSELSAHWRQRYKESGLDSQRSFLGVSSAAARGNPGQVNYSAAKAGVLGMMRTAARELEQYNVRVNAMIPAAVTSMMKQGIPDERIEEWPLEELGPERVAPLPIALFADGAEDLTGWTFAIGGDSIYVVSDPEFTQQASMDGGWTPEKLGETLGQLVEGEERSKTGYAGLFGELVE